MLNREYDNQIGGGAVEKIIVNGHEVVPVTVQEIVCKSRHVRVPLWAVKCDIYMLGGGGHGTSGSMFRRGRGGTAGEWHHIKLHGLHGGEIIVTIGIPGEPTRVRYYEIRSCANGGVHGGNGTHTGLGAQTWAHVRGQLTTHPAGSKKKYILRGSDSTPVVGMSSKGFGGGGAGGHAFYGEHGRGTSGACYIFFSNVP